MTGSTERTDRGRPALADRPPVSRTGASDSADTFLAHPCTGCLVSDLVDVGGDCGDLRLDPVDEFCHDCIGFKD